LFNIELRGFLCLNPKSGTLIAFIFVVSTQILEHRSGRFTVVRELIKLIEKCVLECKVY
jgi:hypothetical protein